MSAEKGKRHKHTFGKRMGVERITFMAITFVPPVLHSPTKSGLQKIENTTAKTILKQVIWQWRAQVAYVGFIWLVPRQSLLYNGTLSLTHPPSLCPSHSRRHSDICRNENGYGNRYWAWKRVNMTIFVFYLKLCILAQEKRYFCPAFRVWDDHVIHVQACEYIFFSLV